MKRITEKEMEDLINQYNNGKAIPKERFWCHDGTHYVEMDNTDSLCYVSDWATKEECFLRCLGYLDTVGNPYDINLLVDFMKMVNHIIAFEDKEAGNVFESMGMPRELADY